MNDPMMRCVAAEPLATPSERDWPSEESVLLGSVLDGKYALEQRIGAGGMASIFRGYDRYLERPVAVKVVKAEPGHAMESIERAMLEARTAARLRSPHIIQVLDMGSTPSGLPYIVLEYLEGCDLADYLRERGPLAPDMALAFTAQLCDALACTHAAGVVHRDLKPENVFVVHTDSGEVFLKLLDFGIARDLLVRRQSSSLELSQSSVLGSPHYMTPEQMTAPAEVDHRVDIWSVGVLLYELLTGKRPFEREAIHEICSAVLMAEPTPVDSLRSDISPELAHVIKRCMEKDPARRFGSISELMMALRAAHPRSDDRITLTVVCDTSHHGSTGKPSPHPEVISHATEKEPRSDTQVSPGVSPPEQASGSSLPEVVKPKPPRTPAGRRARSQSERPRPRM